MAVISVFGVGCELEPSNQRLDPYDAGATVEVTEPLDLRFEVVNGIPTFSTEDAFEKALQTVISRPSGDLKAWTHGLSVSTLFGSIVDAEEAGSISADATPLEKLFLTTDPVTGDVIHSTEVFGLTHYLQNSEGFISVVGLVGFVSNSLQVWAPFEQYSELRSAVMSDDATSVHQFDVIYDNRTHNNLAARGDDPVYYLGCPWAADNTATQYHTNVAGRYRCQTRWVHTQLITGSYPNRRVRQSLTVDGFSRKKSFGYKTNHYFRWDFEYVVNDGAGITRRSVKQKQDNNEKRVLQTHYYNDISGIRNATELARASTTITGTLNGTTHSHRGMGGEVNELVCF